MNFVHFAKEVLEIFASLKNSTIIEDRIALVMITCTLSHYPCYTILILHPRNRFETHNLHLPCDKKDSDKTAHNSS